MSQVASLLGGDQAAIALLDVRTPGPTDAFGLVNALDLRQRQRVLLLTWRLTWRIVRQFVDAGIVDFVKMPTTVSELLLRVELRSRGAHLFPFADNNEPSTGIPSPSRLDGLTDIDLIRVRLSDREYLLYELLAERFGEAVNRADILARIWGRGVGNEATSNIVDVYVRYLRVKLARLAPSLAIRTVRRVGYVLERNGDPTM